MASNFEVSLEGTETAREAAEGKGRAQDLSKSLEFNLDREKQKKGWGISHGQC